MHSGSTNHFLHGKEGTNTHLKNSEIYFPSENAAQGKQQRPRTAAARSAAASPCREDALGSFQLFRLGAPEPGGELRSISRKGNCRGSCAAQENPLPALPGCHRQAVSERLVTARVPRFPSSTQRLSPHTAECLIGVPHTYRGVALNEVTSAIKALRRQTLAAAGCYGVTGFWF